ncbi:hypothetical protein [Chitinivorax sp. B]|uniref:hypothetical protein n=1 Tax=Chitinivorax sp. B TaxID=2502235 RepID=UPI0010F52724|nr:hypothetical protein [Chitinivorax sp. B]
MKLFLLASLFKRCVGIISIFCVIWIFTSQYSYFSTLLTQISIESLISSIVLIIISHFFLAYSNVYLWSCLGFQVSAGTAIKIHFSNMLARYLPGGIWQTVSKLSVYKEILKPGKEQILAYLFLENVMALGTASLLGAVAVLVADGVGVLRVLLLFAALSLIVSPWIIRFRVFRLPDQSSPFRISLYFIFFRCFICVWLCYGLAFSCYWFSYEHIGFGDVTDWVKVAGIYWISWAAGFIAIFSPQGIGVSEIVASYLLSGTNTEMAIRFVGVVGMYRLLVLAAEILLWASAMCFYKFFRLTQI